MRAGFEPRLLILCPLAREWSFLVKTFEASLHVERLHHLKVEAAYIPDWRALVAPGGHGKIQFAVQAQYLIGQFSTGGTRDLCRCSRKPRARSICWRCRGRDGDSRA